MEAHQAQGYRENLQMAKNLAKEDPRVVLINEMVGKGRTPYALNFGQTYNDPNGPWIPVARDAVFGPDAAKALKDGAPKITESLGQS